MTNIIINNASRSAVNDKEETINYNNMPKDICERFSLKNNTSKAIAKRHLADFSNKLTLDNASVQQNWNFIEYSEASTTTSKNPGQI